MVIYNTLTRKKEEFIPLEPNKVKMYACGPTVYNFFHIGNARCFVVFDMFRRYLKYRGYDVTFVQNFTDIDDKLIRKANEEGTTVKEIAEKYIKEYFTDAKGLGVQPADIHPRATENIDTIIEIISSLLEKGHAYISNGDVYFRTQSFTCYGCLSHMPIEDLEAGARVDVSEQKENPLDFALWKAAKPGEPAWESPFGLGRPGWHIECSAMVKRYLGESIDIHAGGVDLTFPHHENEIAQSEASTGKPFVKYWMHNGYINVDNKKMSKSLNNFFTVRDIAQEYGYLPIRFFILSSHYRSPINFSKEIIEQAKSALERLHNCENNLRFYIENTQVENDNRFEEYKQLFDSRKAQFIAELDDDFNTANAISVIFELVRDINTMLGEGGIGKTTAKYAYSLFTELVGLLGFNAQEEKDDEFVALVESKIAERAAAKKEKNYAKADQIRNELAKMGVILEDTPQGTKWKKA